MFQLCLLLFYYDSGPLFIASTTNPCLQNSLNESIPAWFPLSSYSTPHITASPQRPAVPQPLPFYSLKDYPDLLLFTFHFCDSILLEM
jgi:hypothetical protein